MSLSNVRPLFGSGLALGILLAARSASAGIPECGNLRLEDVGNCDLRGSVSCQASCGDVGVYKKACATKLQTVCRKECTLSAEPTCTDECTVSCQEECDRGVPITCKHNCFKECTEPCQLKCVGSENPERCVASCEATCDGECDVQCPKVVDGSCYQHCIECCHGSCGAQANMDCQVNCQEKEFETCEYELKLDCSGACSGSGALFCDDEFVLGSEGLGPCVTALASQGIANVEVKGSVSVSSKNAGCAIGPVPLDAHSSWAALAAALSFALRRRRR